MTSLAPLISRILEDQVVEWHGIHGLSHWGRVYDNGVRLAMETGANSRVVALFAFFHDSQRFHDGTDIGHGHRGAEYAKTLRGEYFEISDQECDLLYIACRDHAEGFTDGDITVQTCWDADRLDLGRVGVAPDREFLCTHSAKTNKTLSWAHTRAVEQFIPEVVTDIWNHLWDLP